MKTISARALIGFLIAPAVPALINFFIAKAIVEDWEVMWSSQILIIFGYVAALILGVPAYFFFKRKGTTGLIAYLVMGALIGCLSCFLYFIPFALLSEGDQVSSLLLTAAGFAIPATMSGIVAGGSFWLLAIWRTPTT